MICDLCWAQRGVGKSVYIWVTEFIRPNDKNFKLAMKGTSKESKKKKCPVKKYLFEEL